MQSFEFSEPRILLRRRLLPSEAYLRTTLFSVKEGSPERLVESALWVLLAQGLKELQP